MEILNNLWSAISTPNETLMSIIAIPAVVIENILIMLLFTALLDIKSTTKQRIMYVIAMSISSLISMYIIPSPFNMFFNYIMLISLVYFIFKMSFLKSTIAIIASAFGFNIITFLISNPYITLLNISSDDLVTIPIYRLTYIAIVYAVAVLAIVILKNKDIKLTFIESIDLKTKLIIFTNFILGTLSLISQFILLFFYLDVLPILVTLFSTISILSYFILSVNSMGKIFKLVVTTKKLESAESYNNTLRILHDNVRGFKHDFDNIVTTIGGYIKTNDMKV